MVASSLAGAAALLLPLSVWFRAVNESVPSQYLDEIFHIPQAQVYCNGQYGVWDPKITTPPGLYLLSIIAKPLLGCSTISLRAINLLCLACLYFVVCLSFRARQGLNSAKGGRDSNGLLFSHSALNAVLFPPLFFFASMYYTDIASTLSVMVYYLVFLGNQKTSRASVTGYSLQVLTALASLMFRQTNIFWTGVAPLLLEMIHKIDQGPQVVRDSMHLHHSGFGDTIANVLRTSWKYGAVYSPPTSQVYLDDYVRTVLSIAVCSVRVAIRPTQLISLIFQAVPHLIVIGAFAAFIVINGSVVLGDKTNHVATINLPQMLYIWPYFVFFSWPLVLPQFLRISAGILSNFSSVLYSRLPAGYKTPAPRIGTTIAFTLLALAVVHVNTIVHPFMLADNRHYTFYIFKRLLRPWWMRYAVTPLYVVCGWACIEMQGPVADANEDNKVTTPKRSTKRPENAENSSTAQVMSLPDGLRPATTSFVLIWLLTTTIQLSTAPLFEPRYLIIPWLFWRIHLPLQSSPTLPPPATSTTTSPSNKSKIKLKADPGFLQAIFAAYDFRLVVETLWYLLINAVTGYIFVTWTFEWPLQPGEKQRFMW